MSERDLATLVQRRIRESLDAQAQLLEAPHASAIAAAAGAVIDCYARAGKVLLFGNGGSAADAQHIAAELVGRFQAERRALPALALTANSSAVTAIGNDYGFDRVFSRQVEALAEERDVAVGISTSGASANVVAGLRAASARGATTVALTGAEGGDLAVAADHAILVPASATARIQECHILVAHALCEIVEDAVVADEAQTRA